MFYQSLIKPWLNDSNISVQHSNIVGPAISSSSQTIATFERNRSQHCWAQHVARVCLATLLRHVATCCELKIELMRMPRRNVVGRTWPNDCNIMQHPQLFHEKFDHFQIWANNTQRVARCCNTSQHGGQTHTTCCTQQCCDMLHWNQGSKLKTNFSHMRLDFWLCA